MKENINEHGMIYALLPVLVNVENADNREVISIRNQIILTCLINPLELHYNIERSIRNLSARYSIEGLSGELIFKFTRIEYNVNKYSKITYIPEPAIPYTTVAKEKLQFIENSLPLTNDLKKYGKIINNKYQINDKVVRGVHYQ